jgi:site-specific DNA-adenine methylase
MARFKPAAVPAFAYPGAKANLRQWLVSQMPQTCNRYVEPFAGRGNVFWLAARRVRADAYILNDLWTYDFLKALRDQPLENLPVRFTRQQANEWLHAAKNDRRWDNLAVLLEPIIMFSGGRGGLSTTMCRQYSRRSYKTRIESARRMLRLLPVQLLAVDWASSELWQAVDKNDFWYLDPPYIDNNAGYFVDDFTHETHASLAKRLRDASFCWMLSGYDNDVYRKYLGAPTARMDVRAIMMQQPQARDDQLRTECIWTNYDLEDE